MSPRVVAVVAMGRNRVIGADGGMPWRLPSDLRHYRALTMGKPMIMGRRTLESIGRVLDGRDTIVLTHAKSLPFEGAHLAASPDEAMEIARRLADARRSDEIVIAGGGEIYRLFFGRTERFHVTEVDAEPEGDTVFPELSPEMFEVLEREAVMRGEKDSAAAQRVLYARRAVRGDRDRAPDRATESIGEGQVLDAGDARLC